MPFEVVKGGDNPDAELSQSPSVTLFDEPPSSISSFGASSSSNFGQNSTASGNYDGIDQIEFFSQVITYLYRRI